ncbi:ty3-gypsy retrotransposon protein [Tanacetum coccineum]
MNESTVRLWVKDHQDAAEKLVRQQAEAFQLQLDTIRAELQATRGLFQNQHGGSSDQELWILAITEYFSLLNTPTDQCLRIVGFNLEGVAAEWFRWMSQNGLITTWDRFVESVKSHFGPSKYKYPQRALSKLLQLGTVEDYQREFENLMNRVTDIPDSLLISFYISGLKLNLQHELLVSRPTTLGDVFSLARIIEAHFEAIAKKEKEQVVKKKTNTILLLQSELASPKIKGSLNADEDIGVDEVSSAIDGVFDMGKSNVESMEVRSKFGEFSDNKKSVEEVVGVGEALRVGEDDDSGKVMMQSKYKDPQRDLSKLLQLGTMEDYQREFEKLMNRVTDIPNSLLIYFYISGLKLKLQHDLLVSIPTMLVDAFFLASIIEARFEAIAKKKKEQIVEKKTNVILPLQS